MNSLGKIEKEYLESLGFIYIQHGKFGVAEVILSALDKCFSNDFGVIRSLGYVQLMQGKKSAALFHIKSALEMHPQDRVTLLMQSMSTGEEINLNDVRSLKKEICDYDKG